MKTLIPILLLFMLQAQAQDSLQLIFDEIGLEIKNGLQASERADGYEKRHEQRKRYEQRTREELPEANRKILHYTDSVLGKHIGGKKGVCRHFVYAAADYVGWTTEGKDRKVYFSRFLESKNMYSVFFYDADRIEHENIIPGDIIFLGNHIAIIYSIEKCAPLDSFTCFQVAEQAVPEELKTKLGRYRHKDARVLIRKIYVEMPETCLYFRLY